MAALPTSRMNLADLTKYMDPNGGVTPVVELLAQRGTKELLGYPGWQPGNLPTGHEWGVRTALPTAYTRAYNDGVELSKAGNARQTEGMAIIEAWSEVDAAEIKLNGQSSAFLAQENLAFLQTMEQKFQQHVLGLHGVQRREDAHEHSGQRKCHRRGRRQRFDQHVDFPHVARRRLLRHLPEGLDGRRGPQGPW